MTLAILAVLFALALTLAYHVYGGWVARQFQLDDRRQTPAHLVNDGVDFVPTRRFYLFGQHFSAIAAAGPIAGPILASQAFGWLPCLLWIGLGVVLIGAVHDFSSLTASVRHGATSIAEITGEHLGKGAGRAMMVFILIALVYVIVAFTDITAGTFVAGSEELRASGGASGFNPGGAVAAASVMYLTLSLILGVVQKYLDPPLWVVTVVFVPLAFASAWAGTLASNIFILDHRAWGLLILLYCCVASVTPVWLLLQPRGYLGGFVLYAALAVGVGGIFFGGYEIQQPAFKSFDIGGMTGALFPFLFVTIACGACSGFHGLVCSGTTSKQIDKERDIHAVGYGAMLAEGFVALIALVTVMIVAPEVLRGKAPGTIYGEGIGRFLTLFIGEANYPFAVTFGAMAFSTFVFDTIDVSTRLGRYIVQELFGWRNIAGAVTGTLLVIAPCVYFILLTEPNSYAKFWTLFGASNQLLAALTLLSITVWLYQARKRIAFTLLPMLFVLAVTVTALTKLALANIARSRGFDIELLNGVASIALLLLAIYVVIAALWKLRGERAGTLVPERM